MVDFIGNTPLISKLTLFSRYLFYKEAAAVETDKTAYSESGTISFGHGQSERIRHLEPFWYCMRYSSGITPSLHQQDTVQALHRHFLAAWLVLIHVTISDI